MRRVAGEGGATGGGPGRTLWRRAAAGLVAALVLAWLAGWLIGSRIAARRVVAELGQRFSADVELGSLHFWPPYWVVARDVVLSSELDGERVEWVRIAALNVDLAWWPFRDGSIELAEVAVQQPRATVVRVADGVHDPLDLLRPDPAATEPPRDLPVQRVTLHDAGLTYRDRTATAATAPLEIGGFDVQLDAAGADGRTFTFSLSRRGDGAPLALASSGTLDVAQRTVQIDDLDASVAFSAGRDTSASAPVAEPDLKLSDARGTIALATRSGRLDAGTITLGGASPLLLEDTKGTVTLAPGRIDAPDAGARVAGGRIAGKVGISWGGGPLAWQASGQATDVELALLAARFPQLGGKSVQGILSGSGSFSGDVTAQQDEVLDALRGQGRGRVRNGRFYEVPLIAKLLEQAHLGSEAVTLSDAAGTFRIERRTIHLDNAALGSPTIGVQGHGDVGFDGRIALDVVVAPLGDWKARFPRDKVPLVGDALASLVGKVQTLFGKASAALYQFHITGTVQAPQLVPVPVPVLTRAAAGVFSRMVTTGWEHDVLGEPARDAE